MSLFRVLEAETVSEGTNETAGLAQPLDPSSSAIYGELYQSLPLASSPNSTILLVLGRGRGLVLNSTNSEEVRDVFAIVYTPSSDYNLLFHRWVNILLTFTPTYLMTSCPKCLVLIRPLSMALKCGRVAIYSALPRSAHPVELIQCTR